MQHAKFDQATKLPTRPPLASIATRTTTSALLLYIVSYPTYTSAQATCMIYDIYLLSVHILCVTWMQPSRTC